MTHAKEITKTAATFIFCLLIGYAVTAVITGQPNPMAWPFWVRAVQILLACLATVLLNQKKPKQ